MKKADQIKIIIAVAAFLIAGTVVTLQLVRSSKPGPQPVSNAPAREEPSSTEGSARVVPNQKTK